MINNHEVIKELTKYIEITRIGPSRPARSYPLTTTVFITDYVKDIHN